MIYNKSFYVVQGWMINELHLKGAEKDIYAIIWGFSKDGESMFSGNRKYLSEFANVSTKCVDNALQSLVDKGLLEKFTEKRNGIVFNSYQVKFHTLEKNSTPLEKSSTVGVEKSSTNNIIEDNKQDNIEKEKCKKEKSEFIAPTRKEVEEYAKQRNREDLADHFYDYYTVQKWVDGSGKTVKNWKAKFITWEMKNGKKTTYSPVTSKKPVFNYTQRESVGENKLSAVVDALDDVDF